MNQLDLTKNNSNGVEIECTHGFLRGSAGRYCNCFSGENIGVEMPVEKTVLAPLLNQ